MTRVLFVLLFLNSFILKAQDNVNSNLFGFRTSLAFIFFDVEDTVFMNDVKSISPKVWLISGAVMKSPDFPIILLLL